MSGFDSIKKKDDQPAPMPTPRTQRTSFGINQGDQDRSSDVQRLHQEADRAEGDFTQGGKARAAELRRQADAIRQ